MDSTILQAVASVFVESSGFDLITLLVSTATMVIIAVIAAKATKNAAKAGAVAAYEFSKQEEENKIERNGKASLYLSYVQFKKFIEDLRGIYNDVKSGEQKLLDPIMIYDYEYIMRITWLNAEVGLSAQNFIQIFESYKEYVSQIIKMTDEDIIKLKWRSKAEDSESRFSVEDIVKRKLESFNREFQKIEKYYKDIVEPELNTTQ
jgi:CRISPR/Cas system-associated endonuclease/helicase Cas3